jgi:hypothetical protein
MNVVPQFEKETWMKHVIFVMVVAVALLVPLAASAEATPTASSLASQTCTQLKKADGSAQFAATYGTNATKSNAFGKCVSKNTPAAKTTIANAGKACAAEETADPAAFLKKYGANSKSSGAGAMKNAMGKCVSTAVKQAQTAQSQAIANAAATCKAARKADAAGFVAKYGGKAANAYGKCVAAVSKSK